MVAWLVGSGEVDHVALDHRFMRRIDIPMKERTFFRGNEGETTKLKRQRNDIELWKKPCLHGREKEKKERGTKVYVLTSSCVPFALPFSFGKVISRGPQRNRITFRGGCKSGPIAGFGPCAGGYSACKG